MKATELILRIIEAIQEYGDLEVDFTAHYGTETHRLRGFNMDDTWGRDPRLLIDLDRVEG